MSSSRRLSELMRKQTAEEEFKSNIEESPGTAENMNRSSHGVKTQPGIVTFGAVEEIPNSLSDSDSIEGMTPVAPSSALEPEPERFNLKEVIFITPEEIEKNMSFSETKTLPELEKELRTQGFEGHSAQEVQDAWITVKRSWYRNS